MGNKSAMTQKVILMYVRFFRNIIVAAKLAKKAKSPKIIRIISLKMTKRIVYRIFCVKKRRYTTQKKQTSKSACHV
jgi:hypothetical protein